MKTLVLIALLCSGCSTVGAVLDAIPDPTPQETCQANGGKWVRTFDAKGNVSGGGCVEK